MPASLQVDTSHSCVNAFKIWFPFARKQASLLAAQFNTSPQQTSKQ